MSTPEHPATPALTRKQMREIRNTGATPVIVAPAPSDDAPAAPEPTPSAPAPAPATPVSAAPLPKPAKPAPVSPPPVADSAVDLGVSPLTRRQARQQEKIRTASVPVITPEVVAAHAAGTGSVSPFAPAPAPVGDAVPTPDTSSMPDAQEEAAPVGPETGMHALFGLPRTPDEATESDDRSDAWAEPEIVTAQVDETPPVEPWGQPADADAEVSSAGDAEADEVSIDHVFAESSREDVEEDERSKAVVSPLLGAGLLEGDPAQSAPVVSPELPASFDQLLTRTTGSIAVPSALIVSQAPEVAPLVGPITATGEVLVTGTFNLPEGLGSMGHAKGAADGKEVDAALIDGELPSHSSPTPIAASAAVSTAKMPGEVIKPPAPEKGSKLMMSLAITAGVLAIALVGVLILAFATGAL